MRIAIVAGEPSGDLLGAGLVRELKVRFPEASFDGVGGPAMAAEGFQTLYPLEDLSVMGLVEVLRHLPRLLGIRRGLRDRYRATPPDVFIGIDAPDFNLGLERQLRESGVRTVHYVSPSVWAWRQGRLEGIRRSVDLMLTLFPFESAFYEKAGIASAYVGHPAADRLPLDVDVAGYRAQLGLSGTEPVVALLPGSRSGEVARLGPVFAATVRRILERMPACRFVAPMVNEQRHQQFAAMLDAAGVRERVVLTDGGSERAMGAADCVLLASGTATLEAMLLKRPMVVAYQVAPLTAGLVRWLRLVKTRRFALPNLLANDDLVPEFIQDGVEPDTLSEAVLRQLTDPAARAHQQQRFLEMHRELRRNADRQAAEAIARCLT